MKSPIWVLKVLSGVHSGAEIPLTEGEFTIGRHDDCDLIFHDSFMAEQAGKLQVTADGISVINHEDGDGSGNGEAIEENQIVWVGKLKVGIFRPGQDWAERSAVKTDEATEIEDVIAIQPPEDGGEAPSQQDDKTVASGIGKPVRRIFGVVTILAIGFGLYHMNETEEEKAKMVGLMKKELPPTLKIVEETEDRVTIEGYLRNPKEKRKLAKTLEIYDKEVLLNVKLQSKLVEATRISLSLQKVNQVVVAPGEKPSTIVLSGYVSSKGRWERAKNNLAKDVKGVKEWVDKVETKSHIVASLKKMIKDKNLDKEIKLKERPGNIQVLGAVPAHKMKDWKEVESKYNKVFTKKPPLNGAEKQQLQDLEIRAISIGAVPHIITKDGHKLIAGARIKDGITLHQVLEDKIIVKQHGALVTHYLNK